VVKFKRKFRRLKVNNTICNWIVYDDHWMTNWNTRERKCSQHYPSTCVEGARKDTKNSTPISCFTLFVLLLLAITPLASLQPFFICALSFSLYALWLATFYLASPLFPIGISFLVTLFIDAHIVMKATRA